MSESGESRRNEDDGSSFEFLKAITFTAQELQAFLDKPGMTLQPLTMRQFVGHINALRGISRTSLKLYDFLETLYLLSAEERSRIFRQLDGSVRTSFAAYEPVRTAIGSISSLEREERLRLMAQTLNRSERSVMEYLYTIDADRAFLGSPKRRGRPSKRDVIPPHEKEFSGVLTLYARAIRELGKNVSVSSIVGVLSRPPYDLHVTEKTVQLVLSQRRNKNLRELLERAQRGEGV